MGINLEKENKNTGDLITQALRQMNTNYNPITSIPISVDEPTRPIFAPRQAGRGKREKYKFNIGDRVVVKKSILMEVGLNVEFSVVKRTFHGDVDVRVERIKKDSPENLKKEYPVGSLLTFPQDYLEKSPHNKAEKKIDFDKVIIKNSKKNQILEALEQVNQSDLIFNVWGFGDTIEKGKGVSMLFYGQPGTGKTLMAQAIADKLSYDLKVISTADIQSSAPGESERNIRKHFKDNSGEKTILLFDECDSLIHSRSATGPILGAQINELLSQLERFEGITIFTTNRLGTLDEAVNRRLALKLEFELPSKEERIKIWQRMFPKTAPIDEDVDWAKLSGVEIAGGHIKNTVLRAARMAAIQKLPDSKKTIKMEHLIQALKLEVQSLIDFEKATKEHQKGVGKIYSSAGEAIGVTNGVKEAIGGLQNG